MIVDGICVDIDRALDLYMWGHESLDAKKPRGYVLGAIGAALLAGASTLALVWDRDEPRVETKPNPASSSGQSVTVSGWN
jgi:hypothetical protein